MRRQGRNTQRTARERVKGRREGRARDPRRRQQRTDRLVVESCPPSFHLLSLVFFEH